MGKSIDVVGNTIVWCSTFDCASVGTDGNGFVDYNTMYGRTIAALGGFAYVGKFTELVRIPIAGGSGQLVSNSVGSDTFTTAAGTLYFGDAGTTAVGRVDGIAVTTLSTAAGSPDDVSSDGIHLYWIDENSDTIRRVAVNGGTVEEVVSAPADARALTNDGSYLYWVTEDGIYRQPL